jgi:predicted DCC family thiol-disulfide oxidoreductase YuxK
MQLTLNFSTKMLVDSDAIHPVCTILVNVEVFRRVYETLGMGWVYAATKLPIVGAIANFLYRIWADLRLSLTGRPSLETIVLEREQRLARNNQSRCRLTDEDE